MILAIIGSRTLTQISLDNYVTKEVDEIVSGGATGVDSLAKEFALINQIKYTEFLPEYDLYGRAAPIVRNKKIVDYADKTIAFWDGKSKGTLSVIKYCERVKKPCEIIIL